MADLDPASNATRRQLLEQYEKDNIEFLATTRPYKSVRSFVFEVVVGLNGVMAHAVLRKDQQTEWFSYGVGDQIPIGVGLFKTASQADTNQSRGRRTNGVEDFIIEGISSSCVGLRIAYAEADIPQTVVGPPTDPDVLGGYDGHIQTYDPGALVQPPQEGSPFNLENVFFEALKPKVAVQFIWDRRNIIPIGTLDQIPEGAGKSFLHANGDPRVDNRYKVPEGYLWRRTDKPDGDFAVQGFVGDPVVIPITNVALAGSIDPDDLVQARYIFVDVAMRVHGLGLMQPGQNA